MNKKMKGSGVLFRFIRFITRKFKKTLRLRKAKKLGLNFVEPNFLYFSPKENSVVIDVGCSYEADFSQLMIKRHNVISFAIDPTKKHQLDLLKLVEKYKGKLYYLPYAVGAKEGNLTFYESKENESGSLMTQHVNVRNDNIESYEVRVLSLSKILLEIGVKDIELLKLDIEGAEYDLLNSVTAKDLSAFQQIFIEFHHHALPQYTQADTIGAVEKVRSYGFNSFSIDDHNYIFFRP